MRRRIYRHLFNKALALLTAFVFLFSNTAGFAVQDDIPSGGHAATSHLAPALSTQQEEFKEKFLAGEALISHPAVNAYVKRRIEKMRSVKGEAWLADMLRSGVLPIPNLLKGTGQFAHLGLGVANGTAIIYIDADVYNIESDRNDVLAHERDEQARWEDLESHLGIEPGKMRAWIKRHISSPDERLSSHPQYSGLTSRQIAKHIHEASYPLTRLYQKYSDTAKVDAGYLFRLLNAYSDDVNIAAGEKPSKASARLESHRAARHSVREALARNWLEENVHELKDKTIVSLSMEGNIPEFEGHLAQNANTKGGLGAYFGDKLEGFADIGMKGFGIQPGYSHLIEGGKLVRVNYEELIKKGALKPVYVGADALTVRAWDEDPNARTEDEEDRNNPKIKVEVYMVDRGGTPDYILMSSVLDVLYPDKSMVKLLYPNPGDREGLSDETLSRRHRFTQEMVFGKAAFQLMQKLSLKPDMLHLNEAHTVVAASQMRADASYDNTAIVYTNHTLVPDGLETYPLGTLKTDIRRMTYVMGLPDSRKDARKFNRIRSAFLRSDGVVDFCHAAMKLSDVINAVSEEHAGATEKLFRDMYGSGFDKPVIGVLNGSGKTWVSESILALKKKGIVPDEETLWNIHEDGKVEAFAEIEKRTGVRLDPEKPTVWAVRRLVNYKSQYPMLRFLAHLLTADKDKVFTREEIKALWFADIPDLSQHYNRDVVESVLNRIFENGERETVNGLGMQVVIGWPPPGYEEFWASEFYRWMDLPALKGKFVVATSDARLLKMQAMGADVCINMPRPLEEACGTSDQRTGLNGGVNIAIKGAGPIEWIREYDDETEEGSGFFISSYTKETPDGLTADLERFYREGPADILQKCEKCSDLFYENGKKRWKRLMRGSYVAANKMVTAAAMEQRYARDVYLPAVRKKADTRTIYELVIRDHYDAERGISGLRNAMEELPFIAESGVKYVYLLGVMEHSDRPFEVIDQKNIDRRAGSMEDLEAFVNKAHELGLKVGIIDWLANQHVSKQSKLCREHPERFLYTNASDGNYWLDKDSMLVRGADVPPEELRRRIGAGNKIIEKIRSMTEPELAAGSSLNIDGRDIKYRMADKDIRRKVNGVTMRDLPIVVSEKDALFVVSATDLVSLKTSFPRRWQEAAQPDLSHPDVIKQAIEAGQFWLDRGLDGFRVDAALATFPDRIKENWGLDVQQNLTGTFISEMRKTKHDCFFLFEGFERQEELLALAEGKNCAVYRWQPRNYATEALRQGGNTEELIKYLRDLQFSANRDNFANIGPEHDAVDFGDPWSKLSYGERNILYFIYNFMPGYKLVFNGEIYGIPHQYNNEPGKAKQAPKARDADAAKRQARARLFSLPKEHKQLVLGSYSYLETNAPWNAMGIARYDEDEIIIGAFNVTDNSGWANLDLRGLINTQVPAANRSSVYFVKESLQLAKDGTKWISTENMKFSAKKLYDEGLSVKVGPKGCEVIVLRKVKSPVSKGSPGEGLQRLYSKGIFDKGSAVTAKDFAKMRGYSETTVRAELAALVSLGLVDVTKVGMANAYYLTENFGRAPPDEARAVIDRILDIPELGLYRIPDKRLSIIRHRVREILKSIKPAVPAKKTGSVASDNFVGDPIDAALESLISEQRFIDMFKGRPGRHPDLSVDKAAGMLKGAISGFELEIVECDDATLLVFGKDAVPHRIIRYAPNSYIDYLSAPRLDPRERHSANVMAGGFKFEILRDRPEVLSGYVDDVKMFYRHPILRPIVELIWSGEYYNLREAITNLRKLSYESLDKTEGPGKKTGEYALKLLHTLMYHENYGIRVEANRVLHDIYTGRREDFPQAKSYKTVLQEEDQVVEIQCREGEAAARIQWTADGNPRKPIEMKRSADGKNFSAAIPVGIGTIHYAVEVTVDGVWRYKIGSPNEPQVAGVIKTQKDMRGKNILEVRTSIFDLPKGSDGKPLRKEDGSLVISTFKELKDKLPDLKRMKYDIIWLMDCFEWGPVAHPGKDPSSFAPLDHVTVAKALGGEEGLTELKKEADRLGIVLALNLIPHISQANRTLPAYMPAYCYDGVRSLVRRSSSDGMGDWDDSFQPNWRRKEVFDHYVRMVDRFARMGFSFRADVGHAFDTAFQVDRGSSGLARIFGDVVNTERRGDGLFRTTDLAGSGEPNVVLSKLAYEIQIRAPDSVIFSENFATKTEYDGWKANDERLVKSGVVPYNSLHEELAHVLRDSRDVSGVIDHILYKRWIHERFGGQSLTIYSSHDYQRDPQMQEEMYRDRPPLQLYGDAIIPFITSIMLLNDNGPVMWHFARFLGEEGENAAARHNRSLAEFWKIWVNNIREFDFDGAVKASEEYLARNPRLANLGDYVVALRQVLGKYDLIKSGKTEIARHASDCISVFKRGDSGAILSFINYGYHRRDIYRHISGLPDLKAGQLYEVKELFRYSKEHGVSTGKAKYLSGAELKNLGLHEYLNDWETVIYAISPVEAAPHILSAYRDSLVNYGQFGVYDRVKNSLVSGDLSDALERKDFKAFSERIIKLVEVARRSGPASVGEVGTILFDVARHNPSYKNNIKEYLTLIALDQQTDLAMETRYDFIKVLRGMQIGELAIASLEARDIAGLGGLALYIKDIASAFVDLGLDTSVFTYIFAYNREGKNIFDEVRKSANLSYTGRDIAVPFYGDSPGTPARSGRGYIYKCMLGGKVKAFAVANDAYCDVLYGGRTAEDLIRRYRFFSLGALEAIRTVNVHPAVIQTNEGATGLAIPYLALPEYRYLAEDPHFKGLRVSVHANHNLDPNYQNIVTGDNNLHKDHLMRIAGLVPENMDHRMMVTSSVDSLEINPTYAANNKAYGSVTVSPGYRDYTAGSSRQIGLGEMLGWKRKEGRYFGEQNGLDTVNWQKRMLRQQTFFEAKDIAARRELFSRVKNNIKPAAKSELQHMLGLNINEKACLFTMLHRLCEQKGYEIAIDAIREVLDSNPDVQIVVGGPAEDSEKGRDFKRRLGEMNRDPRYKGRFKNIGGVNPNTRLYELMYLAADAFLMPSKFEPAGLSQLEALAAGTVVVARDVDGLSSSVVDTKESDSRGAPANGFKFFDFKAADLRKAMERAVAMFRERGMIPEGRRMSEWDQLSYNAITYDSRWIRPAKFYINDIFARNTGVNMEHVADFPELLLIMNEAEKSEKQWNSPDSRESLEKRLIEHGYNTERGLDHVMEDAVAELRNIIEDQEESRPLVKKLAVKYYKKYKAKTAAKSESPSMSSGEADEDVSAALYLLSAQAAGSRIENGVVYEIRYNEKRLRTLPLYEDIVEAYSALLKVRAGDPKNIILIPSSQEESLVSIRSYKDHSARARGDIFGEGVVNFRGDLKDLRLVAVLNMALAASNIRLNTPYASMDESEKNFVRIVKDICRSITGEDVAEDVVLDFIKDLPRIVPLPVDKIEEYNRLTLQKLQQSA